MSDKSFKKFRVKDLVSLHMSGPSPTCEERTVSDLTEWGLLKTTAVVWKGWNANAHKVPPKQYWNNPGIEVQKNDVIVTKAGPRQRVGVVVHVDDTPPQLMVSGKMIGLRPIPGLVDGRVLAAALSSEKVQRYIDTRTTGMAESQLNFTNEFLLNTEIYIPPFESHSRLGDLISCLNNCIQKTEALIEKYQQIKAGLMHDLFTRGITPDGKLRPTREQAPELYQKTSIGWIPKEWKFDSIGLLNESVVDGPFGSNLKTEHYVSDPEVRVVRLQNIQATSYNDDDRAYISYKHALTIFRNKVGGGDILIAGLGEDRYPVGRACIYPEGLEYAINKADCFRLRCRPNKMINSYMMYFLNTYGARIQIRKFEQGVTRSRINLGNFKKIYAPRPNLDEQKLCVEKLDKLQLLIGAEHKKLEKLIKNKQGLMHDLLTGKVQVKIGKPEDAQAHV